MPRKVLTMKAAAAALVAALSLGGVAVAANGLLPDQAPPTGADAAAHDLGTAAAANLGGVGERRVG